MQTQTITYTMTNEFHNTSSSVRLRAITSGSFAGMHEISRRTVLRLRRKLCGVPGCVCGGTFGERGGAYLYLVTMDYDNNYIVDLTMSMP